MKIRSMEFTRLRNDGDHGHRKMTMTAEIEDDEDREECARLLMAHVEAALGENATYEAALRKLAAEEQGDALAERQEQLLQERKSRIREEEARKAAIERAPAPDLDDEIPF